VDMLHDTCGWSCGVWRLDTYQSAEGSTQH